jgi:hypothetical protein
VYQITAIVDTETVEVAQGSVLATGAKTGDICSFDEEITVEWIVTDDTSPSAIQIHIGVTEDCRMVVEDLALMKDPPTETPPNAKLSYAPEPEKPSDSTSSVGDGAGGAVPLTAVNHKGWAENTVEEYITST